MEGRAQLLAVLRDAQTQGFLGPGDPAVHLDHALGFVEVAIGALGCPPDRFADLGTGGGVPGLVLARSWATSAATFIESSGRRCEALEAWARELGMADRVEVLQGRAEVRARAADTRETFDLVTARSFARPSVTAEISSGLVRVGGFLIVSDPPVALGDRWPAGALDALGFGPAAQTVANGAHYAALPKVRPAPEDVPRPVGKLRKRPLW